ncbi:MAG: hypothetical protein DHS20C14_16950 [Phycisphaeraceae bacterium]|nr:MAG: hypothetical protein DHS20C14_16950 [Phycisphaeraceae bacterium]
MTNPTNHPDTPGAGSLLEGLEDAPPSAPRRPTLAEWTGAHGSGFAAWWRAAWASRASRVLVCASALMLTSAGAMGAWLAWRPVPKPDYDSGRLDTLFHYTLLTDEFNRLPVDERIALISDLVSRVGDMNSNDSVLLAAFAAQISGPARDQLIENASRVMIDLTDQAAAGYNAAAPPEQRTAYMEDAIVRMARSMNAMAGQGGDATDEEILDEARAQAARDAAAIDSGKVSAEDVGQFAGVLTRTMGASSSAQQKLRLAAFGRDMARTLRGQDIETGKPPPKGP